ncbi:hypothetical protein [Pseudonocardia kunmingensis]|uniref:Uncharacterized protein n=1 Tax=Pseudonocardia kunmingensis TaxID=630975 RepID=A0A543DZY9_9PSEU|nr:hypothetical protein [Pseudonocardia kunmingensis]TQM14854.1 hypothetical protein FB558_1632 [Pseudonocardia kunmingensis]
MWLRVTLLLVVTGWSVLVAVRREQRVLRRLARAGRGSVRRALVVVTASYLALVAVLALCGLAAAIAHDAGLPALAILALLVGLTVTAPFLWLLAPAAGEWLGPVTSFRDLRRHGAKKGVARAIAYPAVVYHFFLLMPAMLATVMAVILVE